MKKALVSATIGSFIGWFLISDIRILQEMGYEVHIACNMDKISTEQRKKNILNSGAIVHHIPFSRSPLSKDNIDSYKCLKKIFAKEQFSLVHCHTPVGGVLTRIASAKYRQKGTKVIYTAHGFHFFKGCPVKNWILFYPIEKFMSRFTDILVTINNEDYKLAKRKFYAKRIERIHGVGIDINKFNTQSDCYKNKRAELGIKDHDILLLSVGELEQRKNHIEVLEAMKTLASKGYKLVIAGNGSLRDAYQFFVEENKLTKFVKLLGYRTDIPELLQAADIYVFPSLFEGLPVALMEAVAAHRPVVCSEVRGNVDTIVTTESYFNTKAPETLIAAIERIFAMTDKEKKAMVEANYQNLLKYRLSEVQKEVTRIYKIADEAIN